MKSIVRGNDFIIQIPVRQTSDEGIVAVDLTKCSELRVVLSGDLGSYEPSFVISDTDTSLLICSVDGSLLPRGVYSVDVNGEYYGIQWRSVKVEQIRIVEHDDDADEVIDDSAVIRIENVTVSDVVLSLVRVLKLTQKQYDALVDTEQIDENTLYVITERYPYYRQ